MLLENFILNWLDLQNALYQGKKANLNTQSDSIKAKLFNTY